MKPFETNLEHLTAELSWLNLLIRSAVLEMRMSSPRDQQEIFKGVFISDGEIDQLLSQNSAPEPRQSEDGGARAAAAAMRREIAEMRNAAIEGRVYLGLPHLAYLFGLTTFEEQIILIYLAAELDLKYEKFFAYLQDDVTRKRPSIGLVMKLLCPTDQEKIQARAFFSEQAPLMRLRLLRFCDGPDTPLLSRSLRMDDPVVNFLLGSPGEEGELSTYASRVTTPAGLQGLRWPDEMKTRLVQLSLAHIQHGHGSPRRLVYHFYGPPGTGKQSLAACLCSDIGVPLLIIDLSEILHRAQNFEDMVCRLFRQAVLSPAALYVKGIETLLADEGRAAAHLGSIARWIGSFSWMTFIGTEKAWDSAGLFKNHYFISLELPGPDISTREQLWESLSSEYGAFASGVSWGELAGKFRLTPGKINNALLTARSLVGLRAGEGASISVEDLYSGCRAQSNRKLGTLARKLSPSYSWTDITLPQNALAQLMELCAQVKHRRRVYEDWGFGQAHSLGKGLCALFYGPSGTGKTMAVEILANELSLEVFKIDLSTVVSKYIGETEKNISNIFAEAESSNAILFFDEADALFGKRSEVKDAHDRYANIEINYLLQRIEEFEGLVILATNLRKNIDEAFFRRMHFAVEFPMPDAAHRYKIWRQHFPSAAPVAEDVDLDFLASRFDVSGANIKNIIINAAFLAAENSGVIHMEHLVRATSREYEKIGRLCSETEFSPYFPLLKRSRGEQA
jgi:SpoVK/Ycf46/Vps4 family AAA+-type ATPase